MKTVIASFDGIIEQRKGAHGLTSDIRVEHKKNVPFELPDSVAEAYLRTNLPENVRYKEVKANLPVEPFEDDKANKSAPNGNSELNLIPNEGDFNTDDPPTAAELQSTAIANPDKVLRFAKILGVEGDQAVAVADSIISLFSLE